MPSMPRGLTASFERPASYLLAALWKRFGLRRGPTLLALFVPSKQRDALRAPACTLLPFGHFQKKRCVDTCSDIRSRNPSRCRDHGLTANVQFRVPIGGDAEHGGSFDSKDHAEKVFLERH